MNKTNAISLQIITLRPFLDVCGSDRLLFPSTKRWSDNSFAPRLLSSNISEMLLTHRSLTNTNNKKDAPSNEKHFIGLKCTENVCQWFTSCPSITTWLLRPLLQSPFASGVALRHRDCEGSWLLNYPRFAVSLLQPRYDTRTNGPTSQQPTNQWANQPMCGYILL